VRVTQPQGNRADRGHGLGRRLFLKGALVGAGVFYADRLAAPFRASAQGAPAAQPSIRGQEIVVVNYGGKPLEAMQTAIFPKFEAETGAKVTGAGTMNPAKMQEMVRQNTVEWDVVLLGPEESPLTAEWLEKLDYSIIRPKGIPREGIHPYGIASDFYSVVMVWRTEAFKDKEQPKSWVDFWDVRRFPGRRTLPRRTYDIVELALMGDGVDPKHMYPIDADRAVRAIARIEPNVVKFWTGGNQPVELLLSGEVDLAAVWVTRIQDPIDKGAPIAFTWNQHLLAQDIVAVPKGSKHVEAAMRFIDFRVRPDIQAALSNLVPIGPSSRDAEPLIQPGRRRFMPTSRENLPLGHFRDPQYWIQNLQAIDDKVRPLLGP
jgi:putative spermidine/putrescine transport system substrate-binding protein